MKLTPKELRELKLGEALKPKIVRLAQLLAPIPRDHLVQMFAAQLLLVHAGDEQAASEQVYRILSVLDAAMTGEGFELQDDPPPTQHTEPEPDSAPVFLREAWAQCGDCNGRGCPDCDGLGELLIVKGE